MFPAAISAAASARLHAAVGRVGVAVLQAEVDEPGVPERQSDVASHGVRIAVARAVGAGIERQAAAGAVVLEQEVDDARDRIRAVLRRGAVTQHLDLPQRNRGNGRDVRSLRTVRHAGEPGDDRRAVAALAVDEHQRMVVGQVAQAGRAHQRGGVTDRVRGDVERGDQRPQLVVERGGALPDDVLQRDGVNRYRRGGHRPRLGAGPDHHHLRGEPTDRHFHVQDGRGARARLHHLRGHGEAGEGEQHVIRPRGKSAERELADPVGDGSLRGARRVPRLHGDAGENAARRVGDRPGDRRVLGAGHAGREHADGKHQHQREYSVWMMVEKPSDAAVPAAAQDTPLP